MISDLIPYVLFASIRGRRVISCIRWGAKNIKTSSRNDIWTPTTKGSFFCADSVALFFCVVVVNPYRDIFD